ncbi:hypothetical protein ES703_00675 [subsurface metagenome]
MSDGVSTLGEWIQLKCAEDGLSLRQVATKVGVSHQTIAGLTNGKKALPQTIKKLAKAFGGDDHQRIALEDKLLCLAGYRTERPDEALSEPLARLLDKLNGLDADQLGMVEQFTVFIMTMETRGDNRDRK